MIILRSEGRSGIASKESLGGRVLLSVGSRRVLVDLLKEFLDFLLVFGRQHAKTRLSY